MDTEKKLLGLLKDAAVMVHRYYFETEMPIKDVCTIVQLLADNYANTVDSIPEDEYTLNREEDVDVFQAPVKKEVLSRKEDEE